MILKSQIALVGLLALCLLSSSGCMGLAAGYVGGYELDLADPPVVAVDGDSRGPVTPEELQRLFGAPEKVEFSSTQPDVQIWRYDQGLKWRGVWTLIVVVPIPLIVPIGSNQIEFTIEDEEVTAVNGTVNLHRYAGCDFWLIFDEISLFRCYRSTDKRHAIMSSGSAELFSSGAR